MVGQGIDKAPVALNRGMDVWITAEEADAPPLADESTGDIVSALAVVADDHITASSSILRSSITSGTSRSAKCEPSSTDGDDDQAVDVSAPEEGELALLLIHGVLGAADQSARLRGEQMFSCSTISVKKVLETRQQDPDGLGPIELEGAGYGVRLVVELRHRFLQPSPRSRGSPHRAC